MNNYDGKVNINLKFYKGEDLYSDGDDIEEELLNIVKTKTNEQYNEVILEKNKWPISYHLSELRQNIIEWIPISKNESVLEIGSGCGALTTCIAKKARKITCIELSKKRSLINAYRNKAYDNIEIIVGNFQDINIDEKYDVITLIGVFEYAASFISGENPYIVFLNKICEMLNDKGRLIIAIENRLGMKYWAGCKEDHVGNYFEGIIGYKNSRGVRTFSKFELEHMFSNIGINKYKFYYPYPDYKFMHTLYSNSYLPNKNSLRDNFRNFDHERLNLFDEAEAFNGIIKSNLFPEFSNSFLIIVEKEN